MKVYIILLNYKGWKDTIECLESIFKLKYPNFQVIVIDNSPSMESILEIEKWAKGLNNSKIETNFPNLVLPLIEKPLDYKIVKESESKINFFDESLLIIKADANLGFSAGNNIGINYAQRRGDFDYCWILNNDTVVDKSSLKNQVDYFKENKNLKIGILGSKLLYYHKPKQIQSVGGSFSKKIFSTFHVGEGYGSDTKKVKLPKIDYVQGASMMVSNTFLNDIGPLSEDYFLYFEELDWAYRSKSKNWIIDWCEDSIIYHKEGGSIGSSYSYKDRSDFSEIYVFKSRKIFYKKFFKPKFLFPISSLLIIMNRIKRFQFKLAYKFFKILVFD